MVPVRDLFEGHLTVSDLSRSMAFFGHVLGLELAHIVPERRVESRSIGSVDQERPCSVCGKWEPFLRD